MPGGVSLPLPTKTAIRYNLSHVVGISFALHFLSAQLPPLTDAQLPWLVGVTSVSPGRSEGVHVHGGESERVVLPIGTFDFKVFMISCPAARSLSKGQHRHTDPRRYNGTPLMLPGKSCPFLHSFIIFIGIRCLFMFVLTRADFSCWSTSCIATSSSSPPTAAPSRLRHAQLARGTSVCVRAQGLMAQSNGLPQGSGHHGSLLLSRLLSFLHTLELMILHCPLVFLYISSRLLMLFLSYHPIFSLGAPHYGSKFL